jgi:hypothetical protein
MYESVNVNHPANTPSTEGDLRLNADFVLDEALPYQARLVAV